MGRIDEAHRAALRRMNDAMAHRGPDAEGTWESSPDERGYGVLLGHRRLSILDLSPAGAQPMVDPTTGHAIVFNGEIYNYRELRERLVAESQHLGSTGDTAVMLRALALGGRDAVSSLRGMFAFACWDPVRRHLLLARDPLGIKPLYLARNPDPAGAWSIVFASEIRALLASGLLGTPRLAPEAVASVVWNGFVVGPGSAVAGVDLLGSGQLVEFDQHGALVRQAAFWTVPAPSSTDRIGENELAEILQEGLGLHLASDVPLAIFLSAGVDSSSVANLAQRAAKTPIHTFTLTFEEAELNEGPIARRIAAGIGTQHREVMLTEDQFVEHLETALDSLDQPTFDGINSYYMSRAVREAGFTVALVGTGGDELFGGYSSFRELPKLHRWTKRLDFVPRQVLTAAARVLSLGLTPRGSGIPAQSRWAKLPHMVRSGDDLLALYQYAYALFLPEYQRALVGRDVAEGLQYGLSARMHEQLLAETHGRSSTAAIGLLEQRLFLGERLLRDNDAASMAASIEQRLPLVDQVLFENVMRLPDELRFHPIGRKAILRRIGLKGLDPQIFERPKTGFVLPFDRWLRRGLRTAIDETLRDASAVRQAGLDPLAVERLWNAFLGGGRGLYWSRVWATYVLVRWCHRNRVYS
jgi:asparagine synthase (glutamine-hydrolysing)